MTNMIGNFMRETFVSIALLIFLAFLISYWKVAKLLKASFDFVKVFICLFLLGVGTYLMLHYFSLNFILIAIIAIVFLGLSLHGKTKKGSWKPAQVMWKWRVVYLYRRIKARIRI